MAELELQLRALGAELEFPPTPELAAAVRARLEATPQRPRFAWSRRRTLVIALAVLAVAAAAGVLAVPSARTAVLELLGLRGVSVQRVDRLPEVPVAGSLGLGERVSLATAERLTGRPTAVPRLDGFGSPDAVYVAEDRPGAPVSLLWGSPRQVRLLLTQFRASLLIEKNLGPGTEAEPITVNGEPGLWLEGAPHGFVYVDELGYPQEETLRLARNTLLWERGPVTFRLEGELSKEEALQISRSVN